MAKRLAYFVLAALLVVHPAATASAAKEKVLEELAVPYTFDSLVKTTYGYQWLGYAQKPPHLSSFDPRTFQTVALDIMESGPTKLHLRMAPRLEKGSAQKQPFVIPDSVFPGLNDVPETKATSTAFGIDASSSQLNITHEATGEPLFRVSADKPPIKGGNPWGFIFAEEYVEFGLPCSPGAFLSGFGEHNYYYFINNDNIWKGANETKLSVFNTDMMLIWKRPMYGTHPVVYVGVPSKSLFYALVFANSHAAELEMYQGPGGGAAYLRHRAVGGLLDLFILTGDSPLSVVQQYYKLVGPAHVPPYWALGVHQARWGYKNISVLEGVLNGYKDAGLPLEALWTDINVMDKFRIFTTDPVLFPKKGLKTFIDSMHENHQRYVQIVDPGVAYEPNGNYSVYNSGVEQDVFLNYTNATSKSSERAINYVWPGQTVFPDFASLRVQEWWGKQLQAYRKEIPIDGVWLDMNEISTFCSGVCSPVPPSATGTGSTAGDPRRDSISQALRSVAASDCSLCEVVNSTLNSPEPGAHILPMDQMLSMRTLDMTAQTAMGNYYQTKNFYGLLECNATYYSMLETTKKRPFLLSRSTFMGSGRVTAHWTGDDHCEWAPKTGGIYDSIQGILASNLFGIPMVGADIGGFMGTTTEELLVRWTQLGAFYPFMRNHHWDVGPGQEPYKFSEKAIDSVRRAMFNRYQLLPYLFTHLLKAHEDGSPVLRHLSLQFPLDAATYNEATSFMFGDAVLVLPLVQKGKDTVHDQYVPQGPWVDLWTGYPLSSGQTRFSSASNVGNSSSYYTDVPALLQVGSVVPIHTKPHLTINATRKTGVSLICALGSNLEATGEGWFDDGNDTPIEEDKEINSSKIYKMKYSVQGNLVQGSVQADCLTPEVPRPAVAPLPSPPEDDTKPFVKVYIWQNLLTTTREEQLNNDTMAVFKVFLGERTLVKDVDYFVNLSSLPFNGVASSSTESSAAFAGSYQSIVLTVLLSSSSTTSAPGIVSNDKLKMDATKPFSLAWYLNGTNVLNPNDRNPTQAPTNGGNESKLEAHNRVLTIMLVLVCVLLALSLIYAAYSGRKLRRAEADDYSWLN